MHIMRQPVLPMNEKSDLFEKVEYFKSTITEQLERALAPTYTGYERSGNIITLTIDGVQFRLFPVYVGQKT